MSLEKVVHLNRYHHFTELMRDPRIEGDLRRYRSNHDGTTQATLILRPARGAADRLFFFFHGMDGDCGDVVVMRDLVTTQNAMVVAMGGRGAAWVSDAFLGDAEQVIRREAQSVRGFYLTGVSMGGTQALSLAALLSSDLRRSILGVIALIPGANLPAIIERSANERVRLTLGASVRGDASLLQTRSPSELVNRYTAGLPFVILCNEADTLLLSQELKAFIARLRGRGHPVATFSAPGDHDFTYRHFDYKSTVDALGSDSTENAPPLLFDEG